MNEDDTHRRHSGAKAGDAVALAEPAVFVSVDGTAHVPDNKAEEVQAAFNALPEPPFGAKVLPLYIAVTARPTLPDGELDQGALEAAAKLCDQGAEIAKGVVYDEAEPLGERLEAAIVARTEEHRAAAIRALSEAGKPDTMGERE